MNQNEIICILCNYFTDLATIICINIPIFPRCFYHINISKISVDWQSEGHDCEPHGQTKQSGGLFLARAQMKRRAVHTPQQAQQRYRLLKCTYSPSRKKRLAANAVSRIFYG